MTRRAPRRRDSAVASAQQLEKLVQTVQRQFMTTTSMTTNDGRHGAAEAHHHRTPPNAAATALGRQVGMTLVTFLSACLDEEKLVQIRDELLLQKIILNSDACLHPSIPHALLETVSEAYQSKEKEFEVLDWLPVWILQIEKNMVEQHKQTSFSSTHLLETFTAALRAYAVALQVDALQEDDDNNDRKQEDGDDEGDNEDDDDQDVVVTTGLLELHGRLELVSSRMALIRHVIPLLVSTPFNKIANPFRRIVPILSPLLTSSILHLGRESSEKWAALQALWRATHKVIQQQPRQTTYDLDLLRWMTTLLDWYLWGLVNTTQADLELQSLELAQTWWAELCGMTYALFRNIRQDSSGDKQIHVSFQLFVRRLLRETFPRLVQSIRKCPLLVLGVQPLLQGSSFQSLLVDLCAYKTSSSSRVILLDDAVLQFRWATLMLISPRGEDRQALLEALLPLIKQQQQSGPTINSQPLIHAVALMHLHDESCREVAAKAIWLLQKQQESKEAHAATSTALVSSIAAKKDFHIIQQVVPQKHDDPSSSLWSPLIRMAVTHSLPTPTTLADGTVVDDSSSCYFSPAQQSAALLFGVALLDHQDNSLQNPKEKMSGYSFLQRLLIRYPHLGISLLPILMDRLNTASRQGNGRGVVRELEFLCQHLVADPHCAQEVWNLVGNQLATKADVPLQVRVLLIRLFPQLLRANKRLYRRVIETLSNIMSSASSVQIDADKEQQQVELRLAVAATISDLAKDDAIRDVSDVIAWIQRLLTQDATNSSSASITGTATTTASSTKTPDTNEHALMFVSNPMQMLQVHYAILSLHYLVVAQELDFDVVLKVLNKRLCPVTNMEKVLQLPPIVLESLVLLLGDGECNDDDDSDDDEEQTGVSPQVSRAVETLLQLAGAMVDRIIVQCNENGDNQTNFRVLSNILKSLGGYSMEALGLNEDLIKDIAGKPIDAEQGDSKSDNRYIMLHQLIVDVLEELPSDAFEKDDTHDGNQENSLVLLLRNLLKFEQEILGSSLWEKRGKRQLTSGEASAIPRGRLSALPSPSSVRDRCRKGDQNSPSIACAILFASEAEGFELLTQFRDEGDACIESTDPTLLVFAVQTYLTTAARIVGTMTEEEIGKVLDDVGAWCKVYTTRDCMYLALAAISLYIPQTLCESESSEQTYAQDIRDIITSAYKNQRFEKDDLSKICLGLVGAASLRQGLFDTVEDIFSLLEQSVRGYCGQQSFGAYYGLGLIGQILPQCVGTSSSSSSPSTSTTETPARNDGDERVFSLISRISGFLVEELLSCFEHHHGPSFRNLVVCFKSGIVTSDLISSISQNQSDSIPLLMTKQVAAEYLCMSCALCLPSLCAVNGQLLLATFRVLETLSWGCGKGVALPTIIRACQAAGLLRPGEMEQVHLEYASLFQKHLEEAHEDEGTMLKDLFVAVIGTSDGPLPQFVRSLLVGDDARFNDEDCALALLASATSICTCPCFGGDLFPLPARLKPTSQADIKSIVDLVSNAVDFADSEMGIVLLGLLSSLRNTTSAVIAADRCLPKTNKQKSTELLAIHSTIAEALDFSKLPSPRSQTILSVVMDAIERAARHGAGTAGGLKSPSFARLLESLEVVVLPDQFSAGFLEPVIHQLPHESKPALVNLLVSQGRGRRPAAMGGTGFIQLSLQISLASHSDWNNTLGGEKAVASFVQNLVHFLPKFPIDTLKEVIANVWHHCWTAGKSLMITFFVTSRRLLEGDRLSEKGKEIFGTVLLGPIMSDLQTVPFGTVMDFQGGVLMEAFVGCLQYLSLSLLESEGFFEYDESEAVMNEEVLRVASSTELIRLGFFQAIKREVHERSRISAWLSRRLVVPLDDESVGVLRRLIFCLLEAVNTERPNNVNKPDQLAELLEILLLSHVSRIGLEWLAIAMSIWCFARGSDADLSLGYIFTSDLRSMQGLSELTKIMVHDLPFNVGTFCRKETVSAIVFNLLHRLFLRWSQDGEYPVDPDILECLQHTLISCRPGLAKEDVFVTLACDALVQVPLEMVPHARQTA